MIMPLDFEKIYIHRNFVDFRKSVNGLSVIVADEMNLNLFSKAIFIFTNKGRDKIKILYWDRTGFALWYKRLEKEKFKWPKKHSEEIIIITSEQLKWLLEGYDVWNLNPHETLNFKHLS